MNQSLSLENQNDIIDSIVDEVKMEMKRAVGLHGPMRGPHEGYAVLLEEVDEVWDLVKGYPKRATKAKMRNEMVQVAAMALRFIYDVCDN